MSQEPWNEEIYQSSALSRSRKEKGVDKSGTQFFTVLVVIFILITITITALAIYLSNGGSKTTSNDEFYNTSNTTSATASSSENPTTSTATASSSATETETSEEEEEYTEPEYIEVLEGEGSAETAARAGITAEELESLNPDKMVGPGGSWLVYPGDYVRIK